MFSLPPMLIYATWSFTYADLGLVRYISRISEGAWLRRIGLDITICGWFVCLTPPLVSYSPLDAVCSALSLIIDRIGIRRRFIFPCFFSLRSKPSKWSQPQPAAWYNIIFLYTGGALATLAASWSSPPWGMMGMGFFKSKILLVDLQYFANYERLSISAVYGWL